MSHRIQLPAAFLLALIAPAGAQSVQFDGLLNSPLGAGTLDLGPAGQLIVSNLGSSGLDGVRIDLGQAQGGAIAPELVLTPGDRLVIQSEVRLEGAPAPVPVTMTLTGEASGGAWYEPDFSGLGQQTYGMRVFLDGQVVYEGDDLTGPTKMHNNPGDNIPEKLYMLPEPFTIVNAPHLVCVNQEGTVTPPGGSSVEGDFVEFISNPTNIVSISAIEVFASGPNQIELQSEELRMFDLFAQGVDDALIEGQGGKLKVSNLGSSGCDGVSIALPDDTEQVNGAVEALFAPDHPGSTFELGATSTAGIADSVLFEETNGQWLITPDFSALGATTYTMELYLDGQVVFEQSGMSGSGVSTNLWALFYKKTTTQPDGTTIKEWCIGGGSSSAYSVSGGPTVLADMVTLRPDRSQGSSDTIQNLRVSGGEPGGELFLTSVTLGAPDSGCVGSAYCVTSPNSAGSGALMCSSGSSSVAANDLVLECTGLPVNQFGIFYYGPNQIQFPFGDGFRCVGGDVYRLPIQNTGATGSLSYALDNTSPPQASGQISAGQQWNFQCWYRDPAAGGTGFNLSDGHAITFLP